MAVTYFAAHAMTIVPFEPYVSEFEFASHFHPSKNPSCPNAWSGDLGEDDDEFSGVDSASGRFRRAPEESSSVGQEPSIEVRAILVRCPTTEEGTDDVFINRNIYNVTAGRSQDILDFHGFDRDEPAHHSEVRECRRKLIITMKFNNIGRTKTQEEFVVIDHVLDPVTMHKARLLNPFVVKVRQEPVLQLYGLKFEGVVNAEATEEVINKKISNYTGCDDVSENPTCGQMIYEGKPIPYSQGFCCFCDSEFNLQRESFVSNASEAPPPLPGTIAKTQDRSIRPFKSFRSENENFRDVISDSKNILPKETSKNRNSVGNSNYASSASNIFFAEDDNSTVVRNPYDDEMDLIRLKGSNGINEKNVNSTPSRFKNSGHDVLTAELAKLEQDYVNLKMSNMMKIEVRNNKTDKIARKQTLRPLAEKYCGQNANDDRSDNFFSTERMENAIATRIYNSHENHISTSGYADKLPLPTGGSQASTLNIAVLFAIRPKLKSTACPVYSTAELPTTHPIERLMTHPPLKAETPEVSRQKLISDRVYPSTGQSNDYKIDQQQGIRSFNSIKPTTNPIRTYNADDLRKNVAPPNDAKFSGTHSKIAQSRLRQMFVTINSENLITVPSDATRESTITSEGTTANSQKVNDRTESFDNLSVQDGSLENSSSSSLSSGNHSRGDAILLRGLLKDRLANWFAHDEMNRIDRQRARKKSRKNVEKHNGIGFKGKVGFFESAIPTTEADGFSSRRRNDVRLTTSIAVREPLEIYLEPNDSFESSYKSGLKGLVPKTHSSEADVSKETFLANSDRKGLHDQLWNDSGRLSISRAYRSIADGDSFSSKDSEQQRSIDKKIEDEFVDISEALKHAVDSPNIIRGRPNSESNFEKDDSVIEKLNLIVDEVPGNSVMGGHSSFEDNSIVPATMEVEDEVRTSRYSEEFVATEIPQASAHDQPVETFNSQRMNQSREISRQKMAMHSNIETGNAKTYELSPIFTDVAMKNSMKYNNHFPMDDSELGATANVENIGNKNQSQIAKHTEKFNEPVSEMPQTTGHEIVVDRFKLVKNYQELSMNDNQSSYQTVLNTLYSTDSPLNVRDSKKNEPTTIHKHGRNTVSDIFRTLSPRVSIDRPESVHRPQKMTNEKRLRENVLSHSSFKNLLPETHNLKKEEFLDDARKKPIEIVVVDDARTGRNNDSFGNDLSPVLMIENLKEELRKEAKRYSSLPTSSMRNSASITDDLRAHFNSGEKLHEVTTELSPVEMMNESVTDNETLPPKEETQFATTSLEKNETTTTPVGSAKSTESTKIDGTLLPRFAISDLAERLSNEATPSKKIDEILILVEESLPLSSTQSVRLENMSINKKRHWRHRHEGPRRNRRRSMDVQVNVTRDIGPAINDVSAVMNGKSENEDDEHPWYETTTDRENVKNSSSAVTKKSVRNMNFVSLVPKKFERREIPFDRTNSMENHERIDGSLNRVTSDAGELYVSLPRIPESNWHSKLAGLRVEDEPGVDSHHTSTTAIDLNVDEVKTTIIPSPFQEPESREEVDELPIFERTQPFRMNNHESEVGKPPRSDEGDNEYKRKIRDIAEIAKNNVQTLSTSRFRSFYPKSNEISLMSETIVDEVTGSEIVGSNNKRKDLIHSDQSDPKALIFYDYDSADTNFVESAMESQNDENQRSLKRNLILPNTPSNSRSNKKKFAMNPKSPKVTDARSFRLPYAKLRRSGNMSSNEFQIEPRGGWKEKMELLKLKKHADVLKEYLNWRHDIAPPEPHGISGYTTKISVTDEKEENMTQTAIDSNVMKETTLRSTYATRNSATDDASSTLYVQKNFTMAYNSNKDDHTTNETEQSGSSTTWTISPVANHSRNNLFNEMDIVAVTKPSTGYGHYETENNTSCDGEAATGRILPPCCPTTKAVATTCPTGLHGNGGRLSHPIHLFEPPNASQKVFSNERHPQEKLDNVANDLIIISVMEKNQRENNKVRGRERGGQAMPKIYRIRNDDAPNRAAHHRLHKSKNKVKHPIARKSRKGRFSLGSRRRLMSFGELDYRDEEDNPTFDEFATNINVVSSADEGTGASTNEKDSDELINKWDKLIGKVISNNASAIWKSWNSTESLSPELPAVNRSSIKQLHFTNADKFIKQLAKKIAHNSYIHVPKQGTGTFGGEGKARNNILPGRRLKSYPSLAGTKIVRKAVMKEKEGSENYKDPNSSKRSASKVSSEIEDSYDDPNISSALRLGPSRSTNPNILSHKETSHQDESGRDFAISLSGKIHVEGGTNGQPMAISFDTLPQIANKNETLPGDSNKNFDSNDSTNAEIDPSPTLLSNLFNIAPVPENLAHHSQEGSDKSNTTVPKRQSPRAVDARKLRRGRKSYRRKLQPQAKKSALIRRSRAVDKGTAIRWPKYRLNRSFDLDNTENSEDTFGEDSNSEDYANSFYADNNDLEDKKDTDSQLFSPKQRNLNSADSSDNDKDLIHQRHNVYDPDVKVIKIIPVNIRHSLASLPSSGSGRDNGHDENQEDSKANIMGTSQLFKMEDDFAAGDGLPWPENDRADDKSGLQDTNASQQCSMGSESPIYNQVSTRNPVSRKVIDLGSADHLLVTNNPMNNVDASYEIVPLIHVKIQHHPYDGENQDRKNIIPESSDSRGSNGQFERMEGCPRIEMTKSSQHFHDDGSCPCPETNNRGQTNNEGDKTEDDCSHAQQEVDAVGVENDQDSKESSGIGPCAEADRMSGPVIPNPRDDEKFDRMGPVEESPSCEEHRVMEITPVSRCKDGSKRIDVGKGIKLKNMLAIMEFMKKMREMMSGAETRDMADTDSNKSVLKLETVVVMPINRSKEIPGGSSDLDDTTQRVVMIGEGMNRESPHNQVTSDKTNSIIEGRNGTATMKDQDKSFLFYDNHDKIGAVKQATPRDRKFNDPPPMDEPVSDRVDQGHEEREQPEGFIESKHDNAALDTEMNNTETIAIEKTDESTMKNSTNFSAINPNYWTNGNEFSRVNDSQRGNESVTNGVLLNLRRKISDRLFGFKNDDLKKSARRRSEGVDSTDSMEKRSMAGVDEFPYLVETKRDSLRSNGESYDPHETRRQIYRSQSLPGREVSQLRMQKFRRLAASKGVREVKRKSKKKRKKKKRRKKKKHKKKGKINRDTENSGKPWWRSRRQLMSLSEERQLVPVMSFDQDQIEEILIEENRNRRAPMAVEPKKIRKFRRAKFLPGKKRKNKIRRKHKKVKKKKKKKNKKVGRTGTIGSRSKRQISSGGTQIRGGQNCMDRRHPPNVNPAKYFESAHCLRFSDLWYSVYELEDPIMEHTVYLQLFEKHNRADGTTRWEDLTQGSMVRMGSFTRHQRDSTPTISFTYSGAKIEPQNRALNLDPSSQRLLVPSPVTPEKASTYPETRGGSGEYLVVKSSAISRDGSECDKAGVGFAAFSEQKDRCSVTKGSCLKNQPLDYWKHDMRARESGKRGCYFLSNFASVPTKPIKYNVSGSGSREYLGLEYHSTHVSAIDIEVRTDYNAIVRVGSSGRVTEVYVDSTALEHTVVTVVISNMGLASSPYQPRITDCPTGLPVSWTKAKGIMQVIPPQHDQRVTLDLYGQLLVNEFHCSGNDVAFSDFNPQPSHWVESTLEVVNHRGELVAMRRIRVQKMDRCFCVWHCLCACIGSVSGMGCQPMSPEHYHAAGFQGPVPVVTTETSVFMNTVKNVLMLSALLVLLLLILGMLKWVVGVFAPAVGRWGLDGLLEGSKIEEYLEPELKCRCVMTDDDGWPVHPDTGQRTVRICSRKLEFFLNLIFFLTYPIAVCCTYCKRSLNSSRQRRCCPDESRMCLINEKGSCPKMICVSTYGDNKNSKLEAEDTRYVIDELKKSQESLQHPKRSKKTDGNKNSPKTFSKKSSHKIKSGSDVNPKRFVDNLIKNRVVFRNLRVPIGGLAVPSGTPYSLRGYFLNAEGGGYRFITPCPFKQHWLIENNQKRASKPPETYPSNLFMRSFGTARDVYESNELSLNPQGICINVQYQEDEQSSK